MPKHMTQNANEMSGLQSVKGKLRGLSSKLKQLTRVSNARQIQ